MLNSKLGFDPSIPVADRTSETDDIIYRISHDLRASVRALQELPSWIVEDLEKSATVLPAPTTRHLELIGSHASRLDLMLTGLLEYSRVGRLQPIAPIKPAEVLADVIDDLGLDEDIVLKVEMDRGSVQMGDADLARVFSILIVNAVRFHPAHRPRIEISGGPQNEREWVIEVCDNGPGIPAERRDFVQQPMTKLVSRDVDPGAGMGLAVLRKIADTYGGGLEIGVPKSGKGTSVRVTLAVN
jgi:signal transduction histidine kinase